MKNFKSTISPSPEKHSGGLFGLKSILMLFALSVASSVSANAPIKSLDLSSASYQVKNGVATIYGTADDMIQKRLIERIVLGLADVQDVRNELVLMPPTPEIDDNIGYLPEGT